MPEISVALQDFYRVVTDEERLKILGLLAWQEQSALDLARRLRSKPGRVLHHLEKLCAIGVVYCHDTQQQQIYRCDTSVLRDSLSQLAPGKTASPAEQFVGDEWERTILKNFFIGMRLKDIPASPKKRLVVTRWLLSQFEPGVHYTEAQLNEILQRHHPDSAFFRKEFVGLGFMERAGGIYWRV
jgi:hypothetical protein